MKKETLKNQIFRTFSKELQQEGATAANTKVKLIKRPKVWWRPLKHLGKLGRRFVALLPKAAGAAFVILVCIAPLIPKETPIFVPRDGHPVVVAQHSPTITLGDFGRFDPSGSYQLFISQFGGPAPLVQPVANATYDITPGDKLIFLPSHVPAPPNYVAMRSGSFLG